MSGLLLLCTELTLFCIELPENCIYLNQSELSNFFMYIIRPEKKNSGPLGPEGDFLSLYAVHVASNAVLFALYAVKFPS